MGFFEKFKSKKPAIERPSYAVRLRQSIESAFKSLERLKRMPVEETSEPYELRSADAVHRIKSTRLGMEQKLDIAKSQYDSAEASRKPIIEVLRILRDSRNKVEERLARKGLSPDELSRLKDSQKKLYELIEKREKEYEDAFGNFSDTTINSWRNSLENLHQLEMGYERIYGLSEVTQERQSDKNPRKSILEFLQNWNDALEPSSGLPRFNPDPKRAEEYAKPKKLSTFKQMMIQALHQEFNNPDVLFESAWNNFLKVHHYEE